MEDVQLVLLAKLELIVKMKAVLCELLLSLPLLKILEKSGNFVLFADGSCSSSLSSKGVSFGRDNLSRMSIDIFVVPFLHDDFYSLLNEFFRKFFIKDHLLKSIDTASHNKSGVQIEQGSQTHHR